MEDSLVLQAHAGARDKLRTLAMLRLASAFALILPALACTLFLWSRTQQGPDLSGDNSGGMFFDVVWRIWVPLALVSLLTGAIFAWLGWQAYDDMKREIRLTPQGAERRGLMGRHVLAWEQVLRVETGPDVLILTREHAWRLEGDWMGRDRVEEVVAYVRTRIPRERLVPAPGRFEAALQAGLKALPLLMTLLVIAILAVLAYWVLVRSKGPPPEELLRVDPGGEELVVPDGPPAP